MAGTDKNINIVIPTQSANFRAAEAYKTLRSNIQFCGADNKVILLTSSTDQEVTLTISGYLLRDDPITETKQLHPNGEICTFQNDLAGINPAQALDWFGEYCNMREELTLPARGRPEWDCGDFIRLESGDAAQIIKSELTFNGAFRETFTVRRGSRYGVGDAQNELGNPL